MILAKTLQLASIHGRDKGKMTKKTALLKQLPKLLTASVKYAERMPREHGWDVSMNQTNVTIGFIVNVLGYTYREG